MCRQKAKQSHWWFHLSRKELSVGLLTWAKRAIPFVYRVRGRGGGGGGGPHFRFPSSPLPSHTKRRGNIPKAQRPNVLSFGSSGSEEEHFQEEHQRSLLWEHAYVFFFQKIPLLGEEGRDTFPSSPASENDFFWEEKEGKRTFVWTVSNLTKKTLKNAWFFKRWIFECQEVNKVWQFFASKVGDFFAPFWHPPSPCTVQIHLPPPLCLGMRFPTRSSTITNGKI